MSINVNGKSTRWVKKVSVEEAHVTFVTAMRANFGAANVYDQATEADKSLIFSLWFYTHQTGSVYAELTPAFHIAAVLAKSNDENMQAMQEARKVKRPQPVERTQRFVSEFVVKPAAAAAPAIAMPTALVSKAKPKKRLILVE